MFLSSNCQLIIALALCVVIACAGNASGGPNKEKAKVPALFTFGDSIIDPGNNNFLPTLVQGNHWPYGIDFDGKIPTGRCSNGKLAPDFFAEWLGLKETLPAFLDPDLSTEELLTGVSFASAGTGFDNLTATFVNVIPMWKQVELFEKYKGQLEALVGAKNSSRIVGQAIYIVCAGTNDLIENYYTFPVRRTQFSIAQYLDLLLQSCSDFIQELYKRGARKFGVYGLPPPGCLPLQKTLYGKSQEEGCVEELNQVAVSYNTQLKALIDRLKARLQGIDVVYINIYDGFLDIVTHPQKYGFETSSRGCCGTGLTEVLPTCNFITPVTCPDHSKYVFWDSVHSTERTYKIISKLVLQNDISKLL